MSFTADIYKEIQADIAKHGHAPAMHAMRKITVKNGVDIVFSVNVISGMRAVYFCIGEVTSKGQFPRWKGINIEIVKLPAYGTNRNYVELTQLPLSAGYIFEIVVENLRIEIEKIDKQADALSTLVAVLSKWREFFQAEKDILMSSERQQGLYGELLFLNECLDEIGDEAISHWAGSNDETHDFYIAANAAEVKTTSSQAPYFAHISSEYQLDDHDIPGQLFLRVYALRKSQSSGEKLSEIVARIREKLFEKQTCLQQFNSKVQKYGYLDEAAEYYTTGYFVRDNYYFLVSDGFPRMVKTVVPNGVADLTYSISVAQCMPFALDRTTVFTILKGGAVNNE